MKEIEMCRHCGVALADCEYHRPPSDQSTWVDPEKFWRRPHTTGWVKPAVVTKEEIERFLARVKRPGQ